MKRLFRLNFGFQAILLIALSFFGCTNKTIDCTVDYNINGKHEVEFYNTQKVVTIRYTSEYHRLGHTKIKRTGIQNNKNLKEIQRVDNITSLTVNLHSKPDSINKIYNIKSTLTIDTVIFNGSFKIFKNKEIKHTVSGHSNHEITEIINNKDTLNWIVTTTFNYNLSGKVKGKSNDLLAYYLMENELSDNYLPEILNKIKDKK